MTISFKRHRIPAEVIRYAVWLYCRLSIGDVEELLAALSAQMYRSLLRPCSPK